MIYEYAESIVQLNLHVGQIYWHPRMKIMIIGILKIPKSTSIGHRSDSKVSGWYLINLDVRAFATMADLVEIMPWKVDHITNVIVFRTMY